MAARSRYQTRAFAYANAKNERRRPELPDVANNLIQLPSAPDGGAVAPIQIGRATAGRSSSAIGAHGEWSDENPTIYDADSITEEPVELGDEPAGRHTHTTPVGPWFRESHILAVERVGDEERAHNGARQLMPGRAPAATQAGLLRGSARRHAAGYPVLSHPGTPCRQHVGLQDRDSIPGHHEMVNSPS